MKFAACTALLAAGLTAQAPSASPTPVQWRRVVVDPAFRSEGIAIGDVNGDGKRDLLVGDFWYEAPAWRRHQIRPTHDLGDGHDGYSDCFACFADDVDRDGHIDEIVVGFPGQAARWYRNPGKDDGEWTMHLIADSACNESPRFVDLFGDGRRGLLMGAQPAGEMVYLLPGADPTQPWGKHTIGGPKSPGTDVYTHGLGVGDIDGDGRADVFVGDGYWLQPADARTRTEPWPFTAVALSAPCAHMHVLDLDGDGVGDVISSSAHARGVWWHRQTVGKDGVRAFATADICKEITQTHSLCVADIDGDGRADLITGKRFWAHGPNGDEEPGAAPRLVWISIERGAAPKFTVHEIDAASGVGTQFEVGDVDGDGRVDVAVSNKKGVFLFLQTAPAPAAPVQVPRRPAFVRALDGSGRPLVGADVTCCSILPVEGWLQPPDVVQAKTDAQGRAKVELRPCLEYTGFVVGAPDADGVRAVSRGTDGLACGLATEIATAGTWRPQHLSITGLDAWGAAAPTQLLLSCSANAVRTPLALADGNVELPALPIGATPYVELIDARGDLFGRRVITFESEQQPAPIAVPSPQEVPLVVVDEKNEPLGGVAIWQRSSQANDMWMRRDDEQWRLCGTTAADGTLVAKCLATGDPFDESYQGELFLSARKDGYGESLAGWQQNRMFQDSKLVERSKNKELHLSLAKRQPLTGKLFDGGVAQAGRRMLLVGMMRLPIDKQSWMNLRRSFRAVVAADGSYTFESLPDLEDGAGLVVASDPAATDVGKERACVPLAPLFPMGKMQDATPTADLAKAARISVSMLDLDKAPAIAARVTLAPVFGNQGVVANLNETSFRLDTAGRATFRAMPGSWFLFIRDSKGLFAKIIDVANADQQISGQLEALPAMRLKVFDGNGKPAKGAVAQIRGTSWSGGAAEPLQLCLRSVVYRLNNELLRAATVDDDGSCILHFATPAGVKMRATMVLAQTYSSQFDLEPDGEQELRIGG